MQSGHGVLEDTDTDGVFRTRNLKPTKQQQQRRRRQKENVKKKERKKEGFQPTNK
jgi:hypothetical protein